MTFKNQYLTKILYSSILLFLISITNLEAASESLASITGTVMNEQGKPVEFASVILLRAKDSLIVKGTISSNAGIFKLRNIAAGDYLIKVSCVGYANVISHMIRVDSEATDISAPPIIIQANPQSLQTVSIVAARPLIERKTDRTVINVANSILAAGNTAFDILERAPGISIDKNDVINLNGKQGVNVMINDKLTYLSPAQLAVLLRSTDGNTIQSIEVITNPSAKYDAAGNSGIINIKLKKNNRSGTNGNITLGAGYGKYFSGNSNISLNHKEGKVNIFGSYSRIDKKSFEDIHLNRNVKDGINTATIFNQHTEIIAPAHNNGYRAGVDYELSRTNTIGLLVNGYSNSGRNDNSSRTLIGSAPGATDSVVHSSNKTNNSYKNIAVNLYDKFRIDTAGQELNIDLDYSRVKNNAIARYDNLFLLQDGSEQHPAQVLTNQTPSDLTIRAIKADYTKPLSGTLKLEAGIKYSSVKTDNDLKAQLLTNDGFVNDNSRTNHFIYDEKIGAGYLNIGQEWHNTSVQIGLRSEYTRSTGELKGGKPIDRNYLNFFPSAFINRKLADKHELGASYSRRIDRPAYDNLNPFIYYLDPYTSQQGNPFLNPQYTNNFELNYTYDHTLTLSFNYSHTADNISDVVLNNGNQTFVTQRNLKSNDKYAINIYEPYTLTKWWTGNVSFNGFYSQFKADTIAGRPFDNSKVAFILKTTQTFVFGKFKAELFGSYISPRVYSIYSIKQVYFADAGISRAFADKKVNIKLAVNDIFNTRKTGTGSQLLNNDFTLTDKPNTRVARVTLTYNFGDNKVKANKHQSGTGDEADRIKKN